MANHPSPADRDDRLVLRIDSPTEGDSDLDEYAYVVQDLKRMALLAGLIFVALIGASLLLR
jgi:hypothetical protein